MFVKTSTAHRKLVRLLLSFILLSWTAAGISASADENILPRFLPDYFVPLLSLEAGKLNLLDHTEKDNFSHYSYATGDQVVNLSVENLVCDNALCGTVYDNALKYFNQQVTQHGGKFSLATQTEFRADWQTGFASNVIFVFKLPASILFWSYATRLDRNIDPDKYFDQISAAVNRQRYEKALAEGNVEMGRWGVQFDTMARDIIQRNGRKNEALPILLNVIATSPANYEAQLDFAENTSDAGAARNSAKAVWDNAESPELISRAGHLLSVTEPESNDLPVLARQQQGLRAVLVPIPPCNIRLLREAAIIYQKIVDIPVTIARLPDPPEFGTPDRIADEVAIRRTIIQATGPATNFADWTLEQYKSELLKSVATKDALSRFQMQQFVDQMDKRRGQYLGDPYLEQFTSLIADYIPTDHRTMVAGVTAENIYSGSSNFVFSSYTIRNGIGASILSYHMMMAAAAGDAYEARKRLAARMAKELVPATLKTLGIARPADPSDPYSYSDGVARLDQKTLTLSEPTLEALSKFR